MLQAIASGVAAGALAFTPVHLHANLVGPRHVSGHAEYQNEVGHGRHLDLELHHALVAAADSLRLSRMYATLVVETRLCLGALEPTYPVRGELVDEHADLIDAVATGDRSVARRVLEQHLDDGVERLTARTPHAGRPEE